jgi:hypothetical protein
MNAKNQILIAILLTCPEIAKAQIQVSCAEGLTSLNRVTIAKVEKIEVNAQKQIAYVFGKRFFVANQATQNANVEKKNQGIIAIPLKGDSASSFVISECMNLAKTALATGTGFSISAGPNNSVVVGPPAQGHHDELKSTHCLAAGNKYPDQASNTSWMASPDSVGLPATCSTLSTGALILGSPVGGTGADSGTTQSQ